MSRVARRLERSVTDTRIFANHRSFSQNLRASSASGLASAFTPEALVRLSPGGILETERCKVTCLQAPTPFGKTRIFDFDPKRQSNVNLGGIHANHGGPQDLAQVALGLAESYGVRVGLFEAPGRLQDGWSWNLAECRAPWVRGIFDHFMGSVLTADKAVCMADSTGAEAALVAELLRRENPGSGTALTHQIFTNPFLPTLLNGPISSLGSGMRGWSRSRRLDQDFVRGIRHEEGSIASQRWEYTEAMQARWSQVRGFNVPTLWFTGVKSRLVKATYQEAAWGELQQNLMTRQVARENSWKANKDDAGDTLMQSHTGLVVDTVANFLTSVEQYHS